MAVVGAHHERIGPLDQGDDETKGRVPAVVLAEVGPSADPAFNVVLRVDAVAAPRDGVDVVTVVTEGIFSYCGVKVKIDTDRHLGPEAAAARTAAMGAKYGVNRPTFLENCGPTVI
mgnify:CR=1 FL=1